ncbi:adenylosuccinate lyase [Candidatus Woesearchaeota archaeon]|nr:adenylosuccinate lyase [Candidatus Woesearchaeota archaeon]
MDTSVYNEPLVGRYTSREMQHIFSDDFKFQTWRRCWTALAEAEMELGLDVVKPDMIDELVAAQNTIDYDVARAKEKDIRHDVMAHVYEYGTHCPEAKGIIHLGATSQFVGCNTDLIQMREAMGLVRKGLVNVIHNMAGIAYDHKDLVTLGYTHYQPAQPTTVGKRMTMYIQDLLMDLDYVEGIEFKARGAKGTTGTQASYLELFDNDYGKVKRLDALVSEKLGFDSSFAVTGQTYSRKFDTKVVETLAGVGVSLQKFAKDIRLLSNQKCVDEPFAVKQTGSSAMAYKRNPMRSERLCGLARKLTGLVGNFYQTASDQWFERTLDDSAIRRMDIPQAYLLTDAILILANNITDRNVDPKNGRPLTFYPKRIRKLLNEELPFMATEAILMDLAKDGSDRQEMHEILKKHSVAAGLAIKEEGADNDLFRRLGEDENFPMSENELDKYLENPGRFAGAAETQTWEYLREHVLPRLVKYEDIIGKAESQVNV